MVMRNVLISDITLKAYKERYEKMIKHQETDEGDELFISKVTAVSEQVENMHVKARVGGFEIESDGPKDLKGSGDIPGPMQLLLASLANCLEITALLYLSIFNVDVNSVKVEVEAKYDKRSSINPNREPFPGYFDIRYIWYIETDENIKKIDEILKKVEKVCPVKGTYGRQHEFLRDVKLV